jgi:hypothetical protein
MAEKIQDSVTYDVPSSSQSLWARVLQKSKDKFKTMDTINIICLVLFFLAIVITAFAVTVTALTAKFASSLSNTLSSVQSMAFTRGTCGGRWTASKIVLQFLLNGLGTIILASSNYLQQICTSPTYDEVVSQFRKRGDRYFGSNSPFVLFRQGSSRAVIWFLLFITSLPVHVFMNEILGTAIVSQDPDPMIASVLVKNLTAEDVSGYERVSPDACIKYLRSTQSYETSFTSYWLILKAGVDQSVYDKAQYKFYNANDIYECYIKFVLNPECRLTVRWYPLVAVAGALILKLGLVYFFIRHHSHFKSRLFNSLGDIILLGAQSPEILDLRHKKSSRNDYPVRERRIAWFRALGPWDLLVSMFWYGSSIFVLVKGVLLWIGLAEEVNASVSVLLSQYGFNSTYQLTEINANGNWVALSLLLANLPQFWVSFGYLFWNDQITRIWLEREWRSFYSRIRRPRVTGKNLTVQGVRSTRFLTLPYWVSGILMILGTLLHYLVSQTLFVVEVGYTEGGKTDLYLTYGPLAMICVGAVSLTLVLGITVYSFIPIRSAMPLMAGSSRVVLESCAMLPSDLPEEGISWGDISTSTERIAGFGAAAGPLQRRLTYKISSDAEARFREST